jgi:glyoxylase-like metal-dependent hydrolase (beta-lactamase superfamily II)
MPAAEVLSAIRKTTDKPIRYVLDTHHHGDHAYGNEVWAKEGAKIIASKATARLMEERGPRQFAEAKTGNDGPKYIGESGFKTPDISFDEKYVLDDGVQRVEFLHVGHMHTAGDAVAYLPKHQILCTGDACVNGAFNFMGHSNSASWIRCLEKLEGLDVKLICPGHGLPSGKELLQKQKRYFQDMREHIDKGLKSGKDLPAITASLDLPWYKEWTGKEARQIEDNVKHVHEELQGKIKHDALGLGPDWIEGRSYCRLTPGWERPRKVVLPNLSPSRRAELRELLPDVEFCYARNQVEAERLAEGADAVIGFSVTSAAALKSLHWVQLPPGTTRITAPLRNLGISVTTTRETLSQWPHLRENLNRFARGDALLGVVE